MPRVYFVPGIAGSELESASVFFPSPVWVSTTVIAGGFFSLFYLAPDGVTPLITSGGVACFHGPPLHDYYDATIALLRQQLGSAWEVYPWGYDFRLDLINMGQQLANNIMNEAASTNPCVIVAHSGGGLVARAAWYALAAAGQTGLVSRIITLGTPHQGSYSVVQLWSGGNSTLIGASLLATLASPVVAEIFIGYAFSCTDPVDFLQVIATWPSYYQTLPLLGSPDSADDPNRPLLYDASGWHIVDLDQHWLTYAMQQWATLIRSPSSLPPSWSLTTMAGTGFGTPAVLTRPSLLGTPLGYGSTLDGDGAVTVASALIPTSWQYTAPVAHADLPYYYAGTGELAAEIVAVRGPTSPVPAVAAAGGYAVQILGVPPLPLLDATRGAGVSPVMGDC